MIELIDLEIGYRKAKHTHSVYQNLNAKFLNGSLVGLIGDNGSGKSTLLKTITGTLKPLSGKVLINQQNSADFTAQQLAQQLSIVVTEKLGGFNLTVWDVVAAGRTPYINVLGKLSPHDEAIVQQSLELMQLQDLKHKLIDELSDGQRQKTMIAKSLAQQTPIIVLDEPTAFLDYNSKHHLFKLLKQLAEEQGKLIIISSHDIDMMKLYVTQTLALTA